MKRQPGYCAGIVLLLGTLLCISWAKTASRPSLQLEDNNGRVHRLEDYRGKIVVLNFWATWCGPCAAEMPVLVKAQEQYGTRGVVVLAASLDSEETRGQIQTFVKKYRMGFPVLTGASSADLEQFGLGESLPATVFIEPGGTVAFRILGQAHRKQVFRRIEWMLGNDRGDQPELLLDNL